MLIIDIRYILFRRSLAPDILTYINKGFLKTRKGQSFLFIYYEPLSFLPYYLRFLKVTDRTRLKVYNVSHALLHNTYLCTTYNAHVNVEISTSIRSIKYVYKCVYKGQDRASAKVVRRQVADNNNNDDQETFDEISTFLDTCYVSPSEGCWRLFSFSLNHEFPTHRRLAVHLVDEQLVYLIRMKILQM